MITDFERAKEFMNNIVVSAEGITLDDDNLEYHRYNNIRWNAFAEQHSKDCQRELDFFSQDLKYSKHCLNCNRKMINISVKIKDLKQTIALYNEAGI